MKISMWIIYDWLKKYEPKSGIVNGLPVLQNIRLFSDERRISGNTVYISGDEPGRCILVNGRDLITVNCGDPDLILNEVLDAFEFYNDWETALEKALRSGKSASFMLDTGRTIFPFELFLADASFRVYAKSPGAADIDSDPAPLLPLETLLSINSNNQIRIQGTGPYFIPVSADEQPAAICNLFSRGRHMGWLIANEAFSQMTRGRMQLFGVLGNFCERWIESNIDAVGNIEQSGPFTDILNGSYTDRAAIEKSLQALGWQENDTKQVYYFRPRDFSADSSHVLDSSFSRLNSGVSCFYFKDSLVLICNLSLCENRQFERGLAKLLKITNTVAGKSPLFTDIFTLPENYQAARIAAEYTMPYSNECISEFTDAVLPYIAYVLKEYSRVDILHPALSVLKQYDAAHGTELKKTLKIFLDSECGFTETAAALSIHRSTLIYRMDRIRALTGINTGSAKERLHLRISFLTEEAGR